MSPCIYTLFRTNATDLSIIGFNNLTIWHRAIQSHSRGWAFTSQWWRLKQKTKLHAWKMWPSWRDSCVCVLKSLPAAILIQPDILFMLADFSQHKRCSSGYKEQSVCFRAIREKSVISVSWLATTYISLIHACHHVWGHFSDVFMVV